MRFFTPSVCTPRLVIVRLYSKLDTFTMRKYSLIEGLRWLHMCLWRAARLSAFWLFLFCCGVSVTWHSVSPQPNCGSKWVFSLFIWFLSDNVWQWCQEKKTSTVTEGSLSWFYQPSMWHTNSKHCCEQYCWCCSQNSNAFLLKNVWTHWSM